MKDFDLDSMMRPEDMNQNAAEDTAVPEKAEEAEAAVSDSVDEIVEESAEQAAEATEEILSAAADAVNSDILSAKPAEEAPAAPRWTAQPDRNPEPAQQTRPVGTYSPYPTGSYRPAAQNPGTYTPNPAGAYEAGANTSRNPAQNAYTAHNAYAAPNRTYSYNAYGADPNTRSAGQIAYTPVKTKAKKEKKPASMKAVAILCACAVLLSGAAGFGGTVLANRLNGSKAVPAMVTGETEGKGAAASSSPTNGDSVVIYKSVDNVVTSTATSSGDDLTYAQVAALVKDSVVEINTEFTVQNSWFQYLTGGAGSGVVISEDGYVITNAHVIMNETNGKPAESITVRLTDGEEYSAELITYDTDEDIAILKIEANGLAAVRCGDSDKLVTGEEVIVVGNPLGELGGSVSNGIISATQREIQVEGVTMYLIQTNAAVNPGNSGGGMFNMKGELIGIVNAKSSGTAIEGLGFAIPINQALKISEELLTKGYVSGKPMIGVDLEEVSGGGFFSFYSVRAGLYVSSVAEGMNDKALKVGDRIIAVDGEEVSTREEVKTILYKHAVGDKLKIQLYRDNRLMEVEVTLFERGPDLEQNGSFTGTDIGGSLDGFFGGRN